MKIRDLRGKIKAILSRLDGHYSFALEWAGEIITLQADEKCEAASVIKLPILIEAFRQYQEGVIDLDELINIPENNRVGGSGVITHLSSNIKLTLRDLLTLMIIVSDNTATNLCIEKIGRENVNRLCQQLGCKETSLQRKLFDQQAIKEGRNNYTCAHDMLLCLREITQGQLLTEESKMEIFNIMSAQQLANKLPSRVVHYGDNDPIIAHKTGEVHGVEHDVAIIQHNGCQVLVAVLLKGLHDNGQGRLAIGEIGQTMIEVLNE